ncbi:MAG: type II secretion system protein M, partial [Candidatus Adiutrix sp.]|nr:type II secretion system protein M [Candidatus Adiutrix sp.]
MAKAPAKKTNPNSLTEKIAKLSVAAKAGVFLGSAVLAGAVFYMLIYVPYSEERDALQSAISGLKQSLSTEQATLKKHQAVSKLKEPI